MSNKFLKLYVKGQMIWNTLKEENGQDLVEYAAAKGDPGEGRCWAIG